MSSFKWLRRPWRWPLLQILLVYFVFMTESSAQSNSNNTSHNCYFPSGVISGGKPCHPNAKNSGCCGPGFECLSNGVCQTTPAIDTTFKYSLYRSGCTDPTFQDPACPRFCFGEEDNPTAGQGLQLCSPELGTYCCKRDYDCCTNSTITYKLGKADIVTIIPSHTAHPTQTHSSTPIPTHSVIQTDERQSTAYARDTIIGVGAGFAGAMAILIVGCCFWLTRRRSGDRYRDRKSDVFEMDTLNSSKLAIHKEVSVSVSQIASPSPPIELDSTARLELDTTRANAINEVVEMFELEASSSESERRPDGTLAHGGTQERSREELSWDEIPSPERRAPDIPILEVSPERRPGADSLAPSRPPPHIPGSHSLASASSVSATASRPVSDLYAPVAGRASTPMPTLAKENDEQPDPVPPIPVHPAPTMLSSETSIPQRPSLERTPANDPHATTGPSKTAPDQEAEAMERLEPVRYSPHVPVTKDVAPEENPPPVPTPQETAPGIPAPERAEEPAPAQSAARAPEETETPAPENTEAQTPKKVEAPAPEKPEAPAPERPTKPD